MPSRRKRSTVNSLRSCSPIRSPRVARAFNAEATAGQLTTNLFPHPVTGGGRLAASIEMDPTFSALDILTAPSGEYHPRLETQCSDGQVFAPFKRQKVGNSAGDIA